MSTIKHLEEVNNILELVHLYKPGNLRVKAIQSDFKNSTVLWGKENKLTAEINFNLFLKKSILNSRKKHH